MPARLTHFARRSGARLPVRQHRGFALLITITLLAFLVLLLVSLASLTRVETQVASNSQQLSQARQNALMALNIALGQLQKYAGPDQRVTATADLVAAFNGGRLGNNGNPYSLLTDTLAPPSTSTVSDKQKKPKGLGKVQAGTRYWTGVWGNFDAPSDIYQATPRPVFLNWLVSGNEGRTFTADVTGGSPTGKITASDGTNALFLPSLTTSPALTNVPETTNATTALTIGTANTPAVLLVGPNTAGTNLRYHGAPANTVPENAIDRYVVAPLVDIKAIAGSVPGLDSNATPVIGRYAYWVGDEGVKAKYNLKDPYSENSNPYTDRTAHYRVATAQRSALEAMGGFERYPANDAALTNVISAPQVRLADTQLSLPDAQSHFHDYTTTARGVLADSQNGGLRRDLTYLLSAPTFSLSGQPIIPIDYSPRQVIGGVTTYCPTFDWLKSFRNLPKEDTGNLDYNKSGTNAFVTIQPVTANQMGVAPVITFVRMSVDANIVGNDVKFHTRLAVILGNPYPVSLKGNNLKVKFTADDYYYDTSAVASKQDSVCGILLYKDGSRLTFDGQATVPKFPLFPAAHNASVTGITQSTRSLLGQINFTISSINLPPGKQKIYSISSNQTGSIGPSGVTDITLSEGDIANIAYMETVVPSGVNGWEAISTTDLPAPPAPSARTYKIQLTDSGNFSVSLLDSSDAVVTKHQHVDIVGGSAAIGSRSWSARDETSTGYQVLGGFAYYPIWPGQATSGPSKGVQLFADYNLRAANMVMPKSSMPRQSGANGAYGDGFHTRAPYFAAPRVAGTSFASEITPMPFWGYNYTTSPSGAGIQEVVLFDVPRRDPANDGGTLLSLGFLQHANLTADDENLNVGHEPGAAFGNSRFNPYVRQREVITGGASDSIKNNVYDAFVLQSDPSANIAMAAPTAKTRFFDMSYLLNSALWDSYYFSTLPQSAASTVGFSPGSADLPNSRLTFTAGYMPTKNDLGLNGGTGTDYSTSSGRTLPGEFTPARYQMIEGAFNINSTSIQAWKSLLASLRATSLKNPAHSTAWTASGLNAPFPRAVYPWAKESNLPGETSAEVGQKAEDYAGFRNLTDPQLQILAEKIVRQVRIRGPFLSLAHFINRSLHDTDSACLSGLLQAVIDADTPTFNRPSESAADVYTGSGYVYPTTPAQNRSVALSRLTGLPGWLSQADILQALGPVISARSDTFCIRVYGEVRDPLDSSPTTAPIARAWCEATVQRCPDYVDSTNLPSDTPGNLSAANRNYGRRFRVVSLRWLTPNDI